MKYFIEWTINVPTASGSSAAETTLNHICCKRLIFPQNSALIVE